MLVIVELVVDGEEDGDNKDSSSEWVNLIDSGGPWHVKNETVVLFCSILFCPYLEFWLLENCQQESRVH